MTVNKGDLPPNQFRVFVLLEDLARPARQRAGDIAAAAGMAPKSVRRALTELRQKGLAGLGQGLHWSIPRADAEQQDAGRDQT